MKSKFKQNHYFYLMIALVIQLTFYPFTESIATRGIFLNIFSTITLIAAIYAVGYGKKQMIAALGLGGFAFFGIWYVVFIEPRYYLAIISIICRISFNIWHC